MEFASLSIKGRTALVRKEWRASLMAALLDGERCVPQYRGGRGPVWRFPFDGGWGIIRPCRRGGLIRHMLREAYFFKNRPLREFLLLAHLHDQGLSLPEPLGVCWERRGVLFRGALAAREAQAVTLREFLVRAPDAPEETLRRVGHLVREMHDLGVFHADLQVENILIGDPWLYLIDFDRAALLKRVSSLRRARNLLRLRRSLHKNFLPLRFFKMICEGYGMDTLPMWLDLLYGAKGKLSDLLSRRTHPHGETPDR